MYKFKILFALLLLAFGLTVASTVEAVSIGQTYQGGIVFFVDAGGQHGLIAAKADQNGGQRIQWFNGTYFTTNATADGLYAGASNTDLIISTQTTVGLACSETSPPAYCSANSSTIPPNTGDYAALVAANYNIQGDGVTSCNGSSSVKCYGDWYLPSNLELNRMYSNIGPGAKKPNTNKGGFATDSVYWSSTETGISTASGSSFQSGGSANGIKDMEFLVRAIRAF
jgi:hypothetical protein